MIGRQVKHYRLKKEWTLKRLAQEIHFAENTIHNWENAHRSLNDQTIDIIAKALDVSVIQLFKKDGVLSMEQINELRFIGTRHLEEMEEGTPENVLSWLEGFKGSEEESGYPAVLGKEYGYLQVNEYWHQEMDDFSGVTSEWKKEHPDVQSAELLEHLQETAKILLVLEPNVQVFVGEKTGPLDAHEVSIFFPFGTTNERYTSILHSHEYAALKAKEEHK